MIKRLSAGIAIVACSMVLGGTASATTARPAPSDWGTYQTLGCDMTHNCPPAPAMTHDSWEW